MEPRQSTAALRVKLLTLRFASPDGFDATTLEDFVAEQRIRSIREHFFTIDGTPHVACLLVYDAQPAPSATPVANPRPTRRSNNRQQLRNSLSTEDQSLFDALWAWRTARAEHDGIPPYIVLTNRELLSVIESKPATVHALREIHGIGAGKADNYGAAILARVADPARALDAEAGYSA